MNNITCRSVIFLFFSVVVCDSIFASYPGNGFGGFRGFSRGLSRYEELRSLNGEITRIRGSMRERVQALEEGVDINQDSDHIDLAGQLAALESQRRRLSNFSKSNQSKTGEVIARGLAGSDWEALEDIQIQDPTDGFWQGITIRTSRALGDLIGEKVKTTVDRLLGGAWEAVLEKTISLVHDINSMFFHRSKAPFKPEELKNWSEVVLSCLEGFGKLIKGRAEFESRSKDMNSRAFDAEDASIVSQDQVICDCLLKHYAMQCDYYAQIIDSRKGYYKENSEVVFIADQLKDWLLEFKNIVLSVQSLKTVSVKFGSNIAMITETAANIKKLFEKLLIMVTPPSYALNNREAKRTSQSDNVQRRDYGGRYGVGADADYPQPFDY